MKKAIKGLIFWIIAVGFIVLASAIANVLAKVITMKIIMTVVYIALGFSFIYILKNY